MNRRVAARLPVILGMLLITLFTTTSPAGSDTTITSYQAVAVAEGVRVTYTVPQFLIVETLFDSGSPVPQAVVETGEFSSAFASAPYPGELAIIGPGLVTSLMGLPSPPAYPFYAQSAYPTQTESKANFGAVDLVSKSEAGVSEATARQGGHGGESSFGLARTTARSFRESDGSRVGAESTSTIENLNIGGILRIGTLSTVAKASRGAAGDPVRDSEMRIDAVSISGHSVGIGPNGFTSPGGTVPLSDSSPLLEALRESGVTVEYVKAENLPNGVVAPGLRITWKVQSPQAPAQIVSIILGRARATASVSG